MEEQKGFHRKYRPKSLIDYIGNKKNVQSIIEVLRNGYRPQVFLLDGHAGCGKTSFARLLAKEYACENRNPDTGACGVCYACRAMDDYIETGVSDGVMNVREIDNSISGNKSDINEILNDVEVPSFDGGWKTYIFDECHLISHVAQGRLLKVLEEPPENVLMVLCTTDPDKLLDTIRSRCQHRYTVTKPKLDELAPLLKRVCIKEGVKVEDRALGVIAAAADFVPREALILLDRVVKQGRDVTYDTTVDILNIVADKYYYEFYKHLVTPTVDTFSYVKFLTDLKENIDLRQFVDGLLTFTMRGIYVYNGVGLQGLDISEIKRYRQIFSKFSPQDIVHLLKLLKGMRNGDIESDLLLLGYQGLFAPMEVETPRGILIDNGNSEVVQEHNQGVNNYKQSITLTEKEKDDKLGVSSDMSLDELAMMFGGEVVSGDIVI